MDDLRIGGAPPFPASAPRRLVEILRIREPQRRNWRRAQALFRRDPEELRREDPQAFRALEMADAMDAFLGAWPA